MAGSGFKRRVLGNASQFPPVTALSPMAPFDAAHLRPPYVGNIGLPRPSGAAPTADVPVGPQSMLPDLVNVSDQGRYAHIIDLNFSVPTGAGIRVIEAPPGKRNFLAIRNTSATANIYIGFGSAASSTSTLALAPAQALIFDAAVPQDDVYLTADAANGAASCAYSNVPG